MTSLQQGCKYSLSNESSNNKSVIFVKLTDSALQSIETYFNLKDDTLPKPSIQFQNNNGVISLPLNGKAHNYRFTLSNIEGDKLQSSFQCVEHVNQSSLQSLGYMFMKMQIHATEDSYEKTKSKMTAVDQEQKNLCTKALKETVTRLGNKVNVKQRPVLKNIPRKPELKNKVTNSSLIEQPIRQRIIQILAAKNYKKAELLLRLKREGINDKDKEKINYILSNVAQLKGNIFVLQNEIWNEVEDDWEFSSKEELQLIKKKKQQFLKPKEMNGVPSLMKSFVKQNSKPLVSEKLKLPSDVKEQGSKFVGKCSLPKNGTLLDSQSTDVDMISPLDSSASNQELGNKTDFINQNNGCLDNIIQCHGRTSDSITSVCNEPEHSNVTKDPIKKSRNRSKTHNSCENPYIASLSLMEKIKLSKQILMNGSSFPMFSILNDDENNNTHIRAEMNETTLLRSQRKRKDLSTELAPNDELIPVFKFPEIQEQYGKIESSEQRFQYAKDFENDYNEYLRLRKEMLGISSRFSTYFHLLDDYAEQSPEHKKLKIDAVEEFKTVLRNNYFDSRKRFEFLTAKLSHIRKLIMDYENSVQCS